MKPPRSLKDGDARVYDSARQEGLPILTYDQQFGKFLKAVGYPVELLKYK